MPEAVLFVFDMDKKSEKGSNFQESALETFKEGQNKREQWILFDNEHDPDDRKWCCGRNNGLRRRRGDETSNAHRAGARHDG